MTPLYMNNRIGIKNFVLKIQQHTVVDGTVAYTVRIMSGEEIHSCSNQNKCFQDDHLPSYDSLYLKWAVAWNKYRVLSNRLFFWKLNLNIYESSLFFITILLIFSSKNFYFIQSIYASFFKNNGDQLDKYRSVCPLEKLSVLYFPTVCMQSTDKVWIRRRIKLNFQWTWSKKCTMHPHSSIYWVWWVGWVIEYLTN